MNSLWLTCRAPARRAAKTVNYCACLPSYNATGANGAVTPVTNGSCVRTSPGELPWCHVVESSCITPVTRRNGLAFDTSLNLGAPRRPPPALPAGAAGACCESAAPCRGGVLIVRCVARQAV